jgi:hypothetical protein
MRMVSPVIQRASCEARNATRRTSLPLPILFGVVAPAFKDWHKAFWDNLAASIQLHHIPKVIAINHRDCGAAKIAYGGESRD